LLFGGIFKSCTGEEYLASVGGSIQIEYEDDNVAYLINFVEKNEKYLTLNIVYEGMVENNFEFAIRQNTYISCVRVDGNVIEPSNVQTFLPISDIYVLPYFEKEIFVDVYYSNEIPDNWDYIVIKKTIINNSIHYTEYGELKRYGIFLDMK
jgi:hypothetical protein